MFHLEPFGPSCRQTCSSEEEASASFQHQIPEWCPRVGESRKSHSAAEWSCLLLKSSYNKMKPAAVQSSLISSFVKVFKTEISTNEKRFLIERRREGNPHLSLTQSADASPPSDWTVAALGRRRLASRQLEKDDDTQQQRHRAWAALKSASY